MNHKKLFTRFVMQPASEQERTLIQAFLENDDEGATIVCKYDIPEITRLICLSDTLVAKEYAEKYAKIVPLYSGMATDEYIDTIFSHHQI